MSDTARLLRRYVNMRLVDVRDNPKGVVLELGPIGRRGRRLILLEHATASELMRPPVDDPDVDQAQIDIGDDIYEQRRYDEEDYFDDRGT